MTYVYHASIFDLFARFDFSTFKIGRFFLLSTTCYSHFIMLRVATLIATVAYTANSLETYQFPNGKDPYRWFLNDVEPKPLNLHIRQDVAPIEGHMMFPNVTGKYPWIDVQHGFLGEFPELVYSEWLATLADMGFVVTYGMPQGMRNPADNFLLGIHGTLGSRRTPMITCRKRALSMIWISRLIQIIWVWCAMLMVVI